MSITDFILPRWKHSNPQVRLKAIREMNLVNEDVLKEMAVSDSDANVRIEAVKRISKHQTLQDIMSMIDDVSVVALIQERLNNMYRELLLKAKDGPIAAKQAMLKQFTDELMLATLAGEIDDAELRCLIVEQIQTPQHLCLIAQSNCGLKAGLKIVEKLAKPEDLRQIAETASNKKVKREAEQKRARIIAEQNRPSPQEQRRIDLENVCVDLETALSADDPQKSRSVLEKSISVWNMLDPDTTHELRPRFDAARSAIEQRLLGIETRQALLAKLERLCHQVAEISEALLADAEAQVEQANREWDAAMSERPADIPLDLITALEKRFDAQCEKFVQQRKRQLMEQEHQAELLDQLESICRKAESIAGQAWSDALDGQWRDIQTAWDALYYQSEATRGFKTRFNAAQQALNENRQQQEAAAAQLIAAEKEALLALCERVEKMIDAEERSGLDQIVKSTQTEWKDTGKQVPEFKQELFARFRKGCNRFFENQADYWEAKDWERWANLNLKEELCEQAEKLQLAPDLGLVVKLVPELKARWKEIGPVARDKSDEIWNRFKTACDQAYQACSERKRALFDEARTLVETDLQTVNWKETTEMIKYIQEEWNRIGFLPNAFELELRESFQNLCNRFFEQQRDFYRHKDEERNENLERKRALLNEAEAVLNAPDWFKYAGKMKKLQQQWKETGPIPKKEGDELWKQFRIACNAFFERLKQERPENFSKKATICEQAERLAAEAEAGGDMEAISRELIELQRSWKTIGPTPRGQSDEIWERFRAICDQFFNKRKDQLKTIDDENIEREKQKEQLIEAAEALSDSSDWRGASEQLKQLQRKWKEIGAVSRTRERELWNRFNGACDKFFNNCKTFFEGEEQRRALCLQQKQKLCLHLEVLAVVSMPEKKLSYSEAAPMADQLSIALELKDEILVAGDKKATWERTIRRVKEIQAKWKEIGPVPRQHDDEIWKRYRSALNLFFESRSAEAQYARPLDAR